jgi:DNA polymerase III subunit gamma/tau
MGFSMTLLRLLAFEPALESNGTTTASGPTSRTRQDSAPSEAESSAMSASASDSPVVPAVAQTAQVLTEAPEPAAWPAFVAGMKLSGMALQLAAQTELKAVAGNEFVLAVPEASRHLTDRAYADKLKAAIEQVLGRRVRLRFEIGGAAATTLAAQEKRERDATQAKTEAAFRDDPFVQDVLSRFDARIKPNSIKPV